MALLTKKDIIKQYNSYIKDYLNKGYLICNGNIINNSNENISNINNIILKSDLDENTIVVWMYNVKSESHYKNGITMGLITVITVKQYSKGIDSDFITVNSGHTLNYNIYHQIVMNKYYTDQCSEYDLISIKRNNRATNKVCIDKLYSDNELDYNKLSLATKASILRYINSFRGCARIKAKDIISVISNRNNDKHKYVVYVKFNQGRHVHTFQYHKYF